LDFSDSLISSMHLGNAEIAIFRLGFLRPLRRHSVASDGATEKASLPDVLCNLAGFEVLARIMELSISQINRKM